jgi:hypothetical protein
MRVAIVGSRGFDFPEAYGILEEAIKESGFEITEVVCGEAPGAGTVGRLWAEDHGIPVVSFPARWDDVSVKGAVVKTNKWGKPYNAIAGKMRNIEMAVYCDAVIACWDRKSPGTRHMIEQSGIRGKKVFVKHYTDTVGI